MEAAREQTLRGDYMLREVEKWRVWIKGVGIELWRAQP